MNPEKRSILRRTIDVCIGVRGSKNPVTRQFDLSGFTRIQASVFDVRISRGDAFSVEVRADDNLFELFDVRARGAELRLGLRPGVSLRGRYTLEARVAMPDLHGLVLNGAAFAEIAGFDELGELELRLTGASELRGMVGAREVDVETSGASRVRLEGTAEFVRLNGSGASRFDLEGLAARTAEAELSGASRAKINASERIRQAHLTGASTLRYVGGPVLGDIATSGASTFGRIE